MKKRNIITALTLTLALGIGATAFAVNAAGANTTTPSSTNTAVSTRGIGLRQITGLRGYDFVVSVAKDMLNLDEEAINKARAEGKTIYDLIEEKGISHDEFKENLIKAKEKAIDEAADKGTITKEEAESYKEIVRNNAANAVPGQGRLGAPRGRGRGSRNGSGLGNKQGSYRGMNGQGRGQGQGLRDGSAAGQGYRGAANGYNCILTN